MVVTVLGLLVLPRVGEVWASSSGNGEGTWTFSSLEGLESIMMDALTKSIVVGRGFGGGQVVGSGN